MPQYQKGSIILQLDNEQDRAIAGAVHEGARRLAVAGEWETLDVPRGSVQGADDPLSSVANLAHILRAPLRATPDSLSRSIVLDDPALVVDALIEYTGTPNHVSATNLGRPNARLINGGAAGILAFANLPGE